MEKYWKAPDGSIWWGNTIRLNGRFVINPTREQLIEAGYTEHEYVAPEPTLEDNKRDVLYKLEQLVRDNVERFTVNGKSLWLESLRRAEIAMYLAALARQGVHEATVWFDDDMCVTAKVQVIQAAMDDLAAYANNADNTTRKHRAAINKCETADEVAAYDITAGYTKTLSFEF